MLNYTTQNSLEKSSESIHINLDGSESDSLKLERESSINRDSIENLVLEELNTNDIDKDLIDYSSKYEDEISNKVKDIQEHPNYYTSLHEI